MKPGGYLPTWVAWCCSGLRHSADLGVFDYLPRRFRSTWTLGGNLYKCGELAMALNFIPEFSLYTDEACPCRAFHSISCGSGTGAPKCFTGYTYFTVPRCSWTIAFVLGRTSVPTGKQTRQLRRTSRRLVSGGVSTRPDLGRHLAQAAPHARAQGFNGYRLKVLGALYRAIHGRVARLRSHAGVGSTIWLVFPPRAKPQAHDLPTAGWAILN